MAEAVEACFSQLRDTRVSGAGVADISCYGALATLLYVAEMARRIAALVLMRPELDVNCERVRAAVWDWGPR